jgi:hypothetical protein
MSVESFGSPEWVHPDTVYALLALVDRRVGAVETNEFGYRTDHFTSFDEEGNTYALDVSQFPLEHSETGAVALIETTLLDRGIPEATFKMYYFFPDGGDVRIQEFTEQIGEAPHSNDELSQTDTEASSLYEDATDDGEFPDNDTDLEAQEEAFLQQRRKTMTEEHAAGLGRVLEMDACRLYEMVARAKRYEQRLGLQDLLQRVLRRLFGL